MTPSYQNCRGNPFNSLKMLAFFRVDKLNRRNKKILLESNHNAMTLYDTMIKIL